MRTSEYANTRGVLGLRPISPRQRLRITPTPPHNEGHVSFLVEAWKTLELPFAAQNPPASRRKSTPECVYPEMRNTAE